MTHKFKPVIAALGTVFAVNLAAAGAASAAESPFSATQWKDGYMVADHHEGKHDHGKWMDKIDTDKDGKISKAEAQTFHDEKFAKKDANSDGFIDADEMKAHREGKPGYSK